MGRICWGGFGVEKPARCCSWAIRPVMPHGECFVINCLFMQLSCGFVPFRFRAKMGQIGDFDEL